MVTVDKYFSHSVCCTKLKSCSLLQDFDVLLALYRNYWYVKRFEQGWKLVLHLKLIEKKLSESSPYQLHV